MKIKITKAKLEAWSNGAAGFFKWLADIKPRILGGDNRFQEVELEPWQREAVEGILEADDDGRFLRSMALLVTPRRHGKTNLFALIVLWLFTTRQNQTIQVLGTSEAHTDKVQLRTLRRIIQNTPGLKAMVGEAGLLKSRIELQALGNVIQADAGTLANAFGDKLNVLWVGDFHACPDTAPFEAFQASLLDSQDTLCLIDANPDAEGGHVHALEQAAATDAKLYCRRIEYADFETYKRTAPKWIKRHEAERLRKTQLPAAFDRDILGKRSCAVNALFQPADIEAAKASYRIPLDGKTLPGLFAGRKYVTGGGLDRAYGFSLHGDNTIWTSVAKVAGDNEEPEYWVLNQKKVPFSSGKGIKQELAADFERYRLQNVVIERYNSQDILAWCSDAKIPAELANASSNEQVSAFTELHRIISERRLHFPRELQALAEELGAFRYDSSGRKVSFEAAKGFKDDRIYSLAWAIWALREQELHTYELPGFACASRSRHAGLCFLRGGELSHLACCQTCEAHKRVEAMHLQYTRFKTGEELSLPEFYKTKVRLVGPRIIQGV
ncbi:hypothetical protein [Desulfocurvibacter africanus]|uniref:hypothetical protein n=1 Tax=Desulfocurvibacter africanus TaxID=873 RepID=UPI000414AC51|nr:hypothetical protein [Desulfocurvibacter africanus]